MGLLDKVKATAEKAAEKAQAGIQQGQQKLEEVQEKRKVDALFRDLGEAVFKDRTGQGSAEISAEIERLLAELRDHEDNQDTADPPPGDFKLD